MTRTYSHYSDTSGSLWQLDKDKVPANNIYLGVNNNGVFNPQSFKYKAALVGKTTSAVSITNNSVKTQK